MSPESRCGIHAGQFLQVASLGFIEEEKERQRSAHHVRVLLFPTCTPKYFQGISPLKTTPQPGRDAWFACFPVPGWLIKQT